MHSVLERLHPSSLPEICDINVVLDLDDEWNEVAAENPVKKPYVFAYILGYRKDNQRYATDFAKKMD